jgi:hypothetical protein
MSIDARILRQFVEALGDVAQILEGLAVGAVDGRPEIFGGHACDIRELRQIMDPVLGINSWHALAAIGRGIEAIVVLGAARDGPAHGQQDHMRQLGRVGGNDGSTRSGNFLCFGRQGKQCAKRKQAGH